MKRLAEYDRLIWDFFEYVPDASLKVGDTVWAGGRKRITAIKPYAGPLKDCIGLVDTDAGPGFSLWRGMETLRLKGT